MFKSKKDLEALKKGDIFKSSMEFLIGKILLLEI